MLKKLLVFGLGIMIFSSCTMVDESSGELTNGVLNGVEKDYSGNNFFDLDVKVSAEAGDYVFAPSPEILIEALDNGFENTNFSFFAAKMVNPGEKESLIKTLFDTEFMMPNFLIIPIKKDVSANKGDIVATWWQSGSEMVRAIVIEGGKTPKVRYLTDFYDKEEILTENSFIILDPEFDQCSCAAIPSDFFYDKVMIINTAGEKALIWDYSGKIKITDKNNLFLTDPYVDLSPEEKVFAPVVGSYKEVAVKQIDKENGRIIGEYYWAGRVREDVFYMGDILKDLPKAID